MDARKELDIQRESGFIFTDESKLQQCEQEDLGKGGYDSEEVGEMSFQPRRKLRSDSDCSFSLFAIMGKQTGSQRAGFGGRRCTFLRGGEHRSWVVSR